jgi:hypothetical protein
MACAALKPAAEHANSPASWGDVVVERMLYEAASCDYRAPLDATLNLPRESYSLGVRRQAAEAASRSSFDEVVTELEAELAATIVTAAPTPSGDGCRELAPRCHAQEVHRDGPSAILG